MLRMCCVSVGSCNCQCDHYHILSPHKIQQHGIYGINFKVSYKVIYSQHLVPDFQNRWDKTGDHFTPCTVICSCNLAGSSVKCSTDKKISGPQQTINYFYFCHEIATTISLSWKDVADLPRANIYMQNPNGLQNTFVLPKPALLYMERTFCGVHNFQHLDITLNRSKSKCASKFIFKIIYVPYGFLLMQETKFSFIPPVWKMWFSNTRRSALRRH